MIDPRSELGPPPGVVVRAEVLVSREHLDEFRDLAAQLTAVVVAEQGLLDYRWFTTNDSLRFVVLEQYPGAQAVFAHSPTTGEPLRRIGQIVQVTQVQVHGQIDSRLAAWVAQHPNATVALPLER